MTLRIAAISVACIGALVVTSFAFADGMPDPEDAKFNPVPSVPGKPAAGVTQPPPVKDTTPAAPVATKPATPPEPVEPASETQAPPPPTPAPTSTPPASPPATPAPTPTTDKEPATQKKQVYEVTSVDVKVANGGATVSVKGTARTGGWKEIELKPLPTFAPEVGMRSYTLVGTPPSGPATQALTPVTATTTIDPLPADVKTIRVLGETNEVAQTFR
jgi:outer membrane biosynthesis protein TonB